MLDLGSYLFSAQQSRALIAEGKTDVRINEAITTPGANGGRSHQYGIRGHARADQHGLPQRIRERLGTETYSVFWKIGIKLVQAQSLGE